MNFLKSLQKKNVFILGSGLTIALICLFLRTTGSYFPGKYLWAEDGNIFINQAATLGITSLWTPYAGYLHTYNRIIALLCNSFSLPLTAYIFYLAWLLSFSTMILVILDRASRFKLSKLHIYALVIFICFQPASGEIFFNLTNSQWPIGAALFIYLLTREKKKTSCLELFFLALAFLSGPFCIFIFPFFLLKTLVEKDLKSTWPISILLLIATTIQLTLILNFRESPPLPENALAIWFKLIISALSFNAENFMGSLAAISFWACCIISSAIILNKKNLLEQKKALTYLLLFNLFFLIVFTHDQIHTGLLVERYRFIPYTLFFFSAICLASFSKKISAFLFLSLFILCFHGPFKFSYKHNYQFLSYVNFSRYIDLTIPINPYPNWGIHRPFKAPVHPLKPQDVDITESSGHSLEVERINKTLSLKLLNSDAYLIFNTPISCPSASDIGLEISSYRNKDGNSKLFWSNSSTFKRKNSLVVFYPAGEVKEYFAFKNKKDKVYLRFQPSDALGEVQIKSLKFYCLP